MNTVLVPNTWFPRELVVSKAIDFLSGEIFDEVGDLSIARKNTLTFLNILKDDVYRQSHIDGAVASLSIFLARLKERKDFQRERVEVQNIITALKNSIPEDQIPPGC